MASNTRFFLHVSVVCILPSRSILAWARSPLLLPFILRPPFVALPLPRHPPLPDYLQPLLSLRSLLGNHRSRPQLKLEHRSFKTPSKKTFDVTTVASNFHIELNPGDVGNADRYLVQEVIKEIAQYHPLDPGASKGFKVVLLTETDRLTKDAQAALRRTMEK